MIHRGGTLLGTNEIENLQRALSNLAVATQRPAINAKVTGVMDDQTMTALSAGLGLLTEQLPKWLYLGLQGVLILGVTSSQAKKYAGEYAAQLTLAANTAAVKFKTTPPVIAPASQPQIVGFFAPGWYKTPIGLGLIALALFVGYKIFIAPKAA